MGKGAEKISGKDQKYKGAPPIPIESSLLKKIKKTEEEEGKNIRLVIKIKRGYKKNTKQNRQFLERVVLESEMHHFDLERMNSYLKERYVNQDSLGIQEC